MPFPPPKPQVLTENDCAICHEPLIDSNHDADPLEPSLVIDDVQLRCGHHFHKSCILEYAVSSPAARERCAICRANVLNEGGRYIVKIKTENGFAGAIDLGDDIEEQAFLEANPDIARRQTFLSLMSQMEFEEAEKFLNGEDGMGHGPLSPNVTYEFGGQTAMHMAAYNNDAEGVQLLLRYEADKDLRDEDGQTALDCAKSVDAKGVIALLKD
ncbi:MAG: hypothetical protein L6R39_003402 [Caloplaca ligustica]|nr:MAG: hypothetical protein L6R39_003402 [Caloplaca ligustica]